MKYLIILSLLFVSCATMAQDATQDYYFTPKMRKQINIEKRNSMVDKVLTAYGFEYNEIDGIYENLHGSWLYQFVVTVKEDKMTLDFYAFAQVKKRYTNKRGQLKIFYAFNDQIRYAVENNQIRPTNSMELWHRL